MYQMLQLERKSKIAANLKLGHPPDEVEHALTDTDWNCRWEDSTTAALNFLQLLVVFSHYATHAGVRRQQTFATLGIAVGYRVYLHRARKKGLAGRPVPGARIAFGKLSRVE